MELYDHIIIERLSDYGVLDGPSPGAYNVAEDLGKVKRKTIVIKIEIRNNHIQFVCENRKLEFPLHLNLENSDLRRNLMIRILHRETMF